MSVGNNLKLMYVLSDNTPMYYCSYIFMQAYQTNHPIQSLSCANKKAYLCSKRRIHPFKALGKGKEKSTMKRYGKG